MPSADHATCLAQLICEVPCVWDWPIFKAHSNVEVVPFSDQCTPEQLELSLPDYMAARAFLKAWSAHNTVARRLTFMRKKSADQHDKGRQVFKNWATKFWTSGKFQTKVSDTLAAMGFEPFSKMRELGAAEVSAEH